MVGSNVIIGNTIYTFSYSHSSGTSPTTYYWVWNSRTVQNDHDISLDADGHIRGGTTTILGSGNKLSMTASGATIGRDAAADVTLSGTGNQFLMTGAGTVINSSTVTLEGTDNLFQMSHNGANIGAGSTINVGGGTISLSDGTVSGKVTTERNGASKNLWDLKGILFTGTSHIEADSGTGGNGDKFLVSNGTTFQTDMTWDMLSGENDVHFGLTAADSGISFAGTMNVGGENNMINLRYGTFSSTMNLIAANNNILLGDSINFDSTASIVATATTHDNALVIDTTGPNAVDGSIDLKFSTGDDYIKFARGDVNGDIHGSDGGHTDFIIGNVPNKPGVITDYLPTFNDDQSGLALAVGTTTHGSRADPGLNLTIENIYGGNGSSTFLVHAGQVTNIQGNAKNTNREAVGNSNALWANEIQFDNGNTFDMFSLLNMNKVVLTDDANLNIGAVSGPNYLPVNSMEYAQITADHVLVNAGSKLKIHEDYRQNSITGSGNIAAIGSGYANIINRLDIVGTDQKAGKVTIDRTTIQGTGADGADVYVGAYGVLSGFGEITAAGGDPLRPNVIGNVTIHSGGTLKPYDSDADMFNIVNHTFKGTTFHVTGKAGGASTGITTFHAASTLSTRLFAEVDTLYVTANGQIETISDGNLHNTHLSDKLLSDTVDFTNVWDGTTELEQNQKVQYDPVFGHRYELQSKQAFQLYDASNPIDNSYYFLVTRQDIDTITGLADRQDANHIFNRDIIKSDMLGEWWFDYTTDEQNVVVRYRMLAEHPTKGGITINMREPNAREAAKVIDIWRYPFQNNPFANGMDLGIDLSAPNGFGFDGYDGDMQKFYEAAAAANPSLYSKYQDYYIADFEKLLLAIQREIVDGADLNHAIRRLHAEPYATMTSVNIALMDQFRDTRERNSMSALFQVENQLYEEALAQAEGSSTALASLDSEYSIEDPFVCNPIRFWATGFGTRGNQKNYSTEYGYDTKTWGGTVGAIKECGDLYFGVTGGYGRSTTEWEELHADAKTDAFMVDALVGLRRGMGFIEAFGNFGYYEQKMKRDVNIANYTGIAASEYEDYVYGGGLRLGYQYVLGDNWLLVPTIGLTYTRSQNAKFTEEGRHGMSVLLDFKKGDIKRQVVKMPITVRLNRSFAVCDWVVTPEVRASFTPIFGNKVGKATTQYVGMPINNLYFTAQGIDTGRFASQVGATLELSRRGRFYIAGNYDFTFQKKSQTHSFSLQTGFNF